ncbi:glycosyltransferase family 87 protein [Novosphingobium sp. Leaf2]|uniref:glycosyltransferase family 87 protein n=1 Tax=Novosphingobium sp. Leaf2 TaxID=1735670 RepID=UPI0006FC3352|nr:glycosyltransferase family 87 protein [Novosphingobium sp. Leaf2]KQM17468.1 hypothetical protein ASE49_10490 [Novosphingobium sp. Leaf2]
MGVAFAREMDWLGAARAGGYLRLFAALNVAMLVVLVATSRGGVDSNGFLLGSDFISFWTSGRMLHHGGNPYDAAAHISSQRAYFASDTGYTAFFYPPSFLPLCWPLGALPYFPALAAWLLVTGAVYYGAVSAWWREARPGVPRGLLFAAFPAVPIVITHGQTAFLVAGLLGLGSALVRSRPVLAGLLLGLATIKPQMGLLLPLVLLVTGEWKTIAAAALSAFALGLVSAAWFGPGTWADWLDASARAQQAMASGAVGYAKMVSPFAAARLLGAGISVAYVFQAIVALAAAALLILAARRRGWTLGMAAAMLAATPLATPFVLDYDLVILAFPLLWLTGQGLRYGFAPWEKMAILLAFAAPAFARPLAMKADLPIMPLVLALLFAVIWRRVMALPPLSPNGA